jgi:hypothetical protein
VGTKTANNFGIFDPFEVFEISRVSKKLLNKKECGD